MKRITLSLIIFVACGAYAKTEFGQLQGAEFRIDVPDNWNQAD